MARIWSENGLTGVATGTNKPNKRGEIVKDREIELVAELQERADYISYLEGCKDKPYKQKDKSFYIDRAERLIQRANQEIE